MIATVPSLSVWFFAKIAALILLSMYLVFSLVLVRQVKLMTDTLQLGFENFVKSLSYIHLAFSVLVLLFAIIIL